MTVGRLGTCGALLAASLVVACRAGPAGPQGNDPELSPQANSQSEPGPPAGVAVEAASDPRPAPIDWTTAGDCLETLWLLHDAARNGRLGPDEQAPVGVVAADALPAPGWHQAAALPLLADLPLEVQDATSAVAAPCVVQIAQAHDQHAEHRVLGQEVVRSLYQSGVRSEKNPDYQVAEARLRQAERQLKDDVPDIISVGDPLLDLVGVVVGGVLGAFSRGSSSGEVDQALAELAATPRSVDRPVYRAYHFEQTIVLAQREATIPVALVDRARGNVLHTELRRREIREFNLLEDLDPRDRDYQQHRAASVTRSELERWLQQPPELPLSTIVAALLDVGTGPERDTQVAELPAAHGSSFELPASRRSAGPPLAEQGTPRPTRRLDQQPWPDDLLAGDEPEGWSEVEPAAGPRTWAATELEHPAPGRGAERAQHRAADDPVRAGREPGTAGSAGGDPRRASVVEITAKDRSGSGFYVLPDLVLTTYQLVRDELVIDITTSDGAVVPGLVARSDPALDLALVQVPRPGAPVALSDELAASTGSRVMALGRRAGLAPMLTPARLRADDRPGAGRTSPRTWLVETDGAASELMLGSPLFVGERVVGMTTGLVDDQGPRLALRASALLTFLSDGPARLAGSADRP